MKIGNVKLNLKYYSPEKDIYSDGDIEEEILLIAKDGKEKEVLATDNRWTIMYYFSDIRKNILSWYPFTPNAKILEIGTGCGAITGLFCEKNLQITGVESSKRRAMITAYRNKEYPNLEINVGNFVEMNFPEHYDYITMIGVLEYANMFLPESSNSFIDMLSKARQMLNNDGKLFIAIENRLGMKYFAGAPEDHIGKKFIGIENYPEKNKVQTFSKSELEEILISGGFANLEWHYPYPDYKLPRQIFSDEFLPTAELLSDGIASYDVQRLQLFNERKAIQSLAGEKEFGFLGNSFLVVASR